MDEAAATGVTPQYCVAIVAQAHRLDLVLPLGLGFSSYPSPPF